MEGDWEYSYGWGIDDSSGWGARYFFTYYTSLKERSKSVISLEILLFICIMLLSVVANAAIVAAILRKKEAQVATNTFIVNLACTDLVFVLGIPAIAAARASSSWELGGAICKLLPYSQLVCGTIMLWTMTGISVDRLCCLASAPYRAGLSNRTALKILLLMWLVVLVIFLPVAIFFREQPIQFNTTIIENGLTIPITSNRKVCTMIFPAMTSVNTSLSFVLPCVIISSLIPMGILVYNYQIILRKLAEIQKRLEEKAGNVDPSQSKFRQSVQTIAGNFLPNFAQNRVADIPRHKPLSRMSTTTNVTIRLMKHRRGVRNLYCSILALLLMWLPVTIVMFLIYFDGHRTGHEFFLRQEHFLWCVIIALTNTIVNPFLYGFLTENFRKKIPLRKWFQQHLWPKQDAVVSDGTVNADTSENVT